MCYSEVVVRDNFVTRTCSQGQGQGYGACLTCYRCKQHDNCGKKQETPVHVSGEHPTEFACLKEMLKRLQDRHVECAQAVANRPVNRRETGLEMTCFPASDLLWVQITQSYPNPLRFWSIPCPESPCHTVIDPGFQAGFFLKR
jgi:hypothetical protein